MTAYPKRPPYFAHRLVRLMTKTAAALEIGPEGCWLVSIIVFVEDAKQYRGPVKYFNETLAPVCGFASIGRLIRARTKAVKAGWLHYESGGKGVAGTYWAEIPSQYRTLPDNPTDESTDLPFVSPPKMEGQTEGSERANEGQTEGKRQTFLPNPIPSPQEESAPGDSANLPNAELLFRLIELWNELKPETVRRGNGASKDKPAQAVIKGWRRVQRDPEAQKAFEDLDLLHKAIRKAKFCHGKGWFTLPWLFGKNKYGEWNAVKLISGGYDDDNHCRNNGRRKGSIGPGQRYDPTAQLENDW